LTAQVILNSQVVSDSFGQAELITEILLGPELYTSESFTTADLTNEILLESALNSASSSSGNITVGSTVATNIECVSIISADLTRQPLLRTNALSTSQIIHTLTTNVLLESNLNVESSYSSYEGLKTSIPLFSNVDLLIDFINDITTSILLESSVNNESSLTDELTAGFPLTNEPIVIETTIDPPVLITRSPIFSTLTNTSVATATTLETEINLTTNLADVTNVIARLSIPKPLNANFTINTSANADIYSTFTHNMAVKTTITAALNPLAKVYEKRKFSTKPIRADDIYKINPPSINNKPYRPRTSIR
jgi:hypothetical protein